MVYPKLTLIVAQPGPLREGLRAALSTMPHLVVVGEVDSAAAALDLDLHCPPGLVVLSAETPGRDALDAWQQVRARWPEARCLILADTVQQQEMARTAGVDTVLLKGFAAAKLFAAVETLFGEGEEARAEPMLLAKETREKYERG
jgi:DNA-binding NarL/FixJ family response regulator